MLPIYYSDEFPIHLPEKHPFPKEKYALLRNQITARWAYRVRLQVPQPATDEE